MVGLDAERFLRSLPSSASLYFKDLEAELELEARDPDQGPSAPPSDTVLVSVIITVVRLFYMNIPLM